MDYKDLKDFYVTGKMRCARPCSLPSVPSRVCPTPPDKMAHVEMAKPSKDFNQVSISEMNHLHTFKGMDDLHRSDAMAREYHRGKGLTSYLKDKGAQLFKSHYFKD